MLPCQFSRTKAIIPIPYLSHTYAPVAMLPMLLQEVAAAGDSVRRRESELAMQASALEHDRTQLERDRALVSGVTDVTSELRSARQIMEAEVRQRWGMGRHMEWHGTTWAGKLGLASYQPVLDAAATTIAEE